MAQTKITRVAIIGGGLGGLTVAQALRNSGLEVTIYERDDSLISRGQGFQIGLNNDGLAALGKAGLPLEGLCGGRVIDSFTVVTSNFTVLFSLEMPRKEKDVVQSLLLDRWRLRELLTKNVNIVWGKVFQRYEEKGEEVTVFFADGSSVTADFVIGADGTKSKVRKQRFPALIREPAGVSGVGGWLPVPDSPKIMAHCRHSFLRIIGPEGITTLAFLFRQTDGQENLLWGISHPQGKYTYPEDPEARKQVVCGVAARLHPEFAKIVGDTPVENIMAEFDYFSMRPFPSRSVAKVMGPPCRVTLLGDAAHPMTSHAGLGANTAFQDAVDLAEALKSQSTGARPWKEEIGKYEAKMLKRGNGAVSTSRTMTRLIHASGPITTRLRNTLMWLMGRMMMLSKHKTAVFLGLAAVAVGFAWLRWGHSR